jgi:hypothetical protein
MLMISMLARMPELRRQVQSQHVSDFGGHCRECGDGTQWPCEVYRIAAAAEQIDQPSIARPRRPWSSRGVAS